MARKKDKQTVVSLAVLKVVPKGKRSDSVLVAWSVVSLVVLMVEMLVGRWEFCWDYLMVEY